MYSSVSFYFNVVCPVIFLLMSFVYWRSSQRINRLIEKLNKLNEISYKVARRAMEKAELNACDIASALAAKIELAKKGETAVATAYVNKEDFDKLKKEIKNLRIDKEVREEVGKAREEIGAVQVLVQKYFKSSSRNESDLHKLKVDLETLKHGRRKKV